MDKSERVYRAICDLLPLTTPEQRSDLFIEIARFRGWDMALLPTLPPDPEDENETTDTPKGKNETVESPTPPSPRPSTHGMILGDAKFLAEVLHSGVDAKRQQWFFYQTSARADQAEREEKAEKEKEMAIEQK